MSTTKKIVILGGGSAGISVAARLANAGYAPHVAIVEPSDKHYYQPLWTLVGAGAATREETVREEASVIPGGVEWVRDSVAEVLPGKNEIRLASGTTIGYETLVVSMGLMVDWDGVKGLREAIGKNGVCSNYSYETVLSTWQAIRNFKGGNAIFTHPATPIKCGGAPQKIMYLADDAFRRAGVRENATIEFFSGEPAIFKVEKYAKALLQVIERKGIRPHFRHSLTELRVDSREAVFQDLEAKTEVVRKFDMIHVTPPQRPLPVLAQSELANAGGWVEVDKATLRHVRFANVYALGDCSSLPTSKTGAAIRKQVPVVADAIVAALRGGASETRYDGYTSCPLVTGYGRLILAEFDYDLKPCETFPIDQSKERWSMYQLKRHVLPALYWQGMLKGRA